MSVPGTPVPPAIPTGGMVGWGRRRGRRLFLLLQEVMVGHVFMRTSEGGREGRGETELLECCLARRLVQLFILTHERVHCPLSCIYPQPHSAQNKRNSAFPCRLSKHASSRKRMWPCRCRWSTRR